MTNSEKTTLIIFDIDGTLTDSADLHQEAFTASLQELGIRGFNTNYSIYEHHTDSYIAKTIYEQHTGAAFTPEVQQSLSQQLKQKLSLEPINEIKGAKALIKTLQNNPSYGICFATGSLLEPAQFKLRAIGIDCAPELIVASDEFYTREDIVATAITRAKDYYQQSSFMRVISVGDGLWDLQTAQNLKLDFIGVGSRNKKSMEEHGAKMVIPDLRAFRMD